MGTMVVLVAQLLPLVTVMVKFMKMRVTMMVMLVSVYKTCSIRIFGVESFSRYPADHSVHVSPLILTIHGGKHNYCPQFTDEETGPYSNLARPKSPRKERAEPRI